MFSCIEGECQAAELDETRQFVDRFAVSKRLVSRRQTTNFEVHTSHVCAKRPAGQPDTGTPRSSSDFPDNHPQKVHVFPILLVGLILPNRNIPRTAAVAGSVVTVIVVLTVALVLVRIRRHKLRTPQRRIPEQFLKSQEHILQTPPAKKGTVTAEAEVNQSNSVGEAVLDEAQLKHSETVAPETAAPGAAPESVPLTDGAAVAAEESAAAPSGPQEAAGDEETMTLRMRRLEAQMGALLAIGLPEGSPPSYSG
ncbi:hypothetical protein C8R45DRAFT_1079992 [Mycena sanguinolenta]|nr:hypothetical protein C8R45DRAFT_1079992 [Mycena sanguinolenta]